SAAAASRVVIPWATVRATCSSCAVSSEDPPGVRVRLPELGDPKGANYDLRGPERDVAPEDLLDVVDAVEAIPGTHVAVPLPAAGPHDQIEIVLQRGAGRIRPDQGHLKGDAAS